MADFWIKIEKSTPDKPEILEMAELLSIEDPDTITGKLIRVWSWFDSNSENGHAPLVTKVLLDRLTGVKGFVDAMTQVGWLVAKSDGFRVEKYDRHLGQSAKKRACDAERKRKSRNKSQLGHKESVTENGLDKSRVDKIRVDKQTNGEFDKFWDLYNKKEGSAKCKAKWNKLKPADIEQIFTALPNYVSSTPEKQYRKNPLTWLNGEHWNDDIQNTTQNDRVAPRGFTQ